MKRTIGALIVTVAAGLFAAPTAEATSPVDPVTLRIGTNDGADGPMAVPIAEFARHVDELSGGSMHIEPAWDAGPGDTPPTGEYNDWDQFVARRVVSGELDMGMIPARAWDTEGVLTLRALLAPFLVDSDALVEAIVADDELAAELLAGLGDIGITGLALLPESLRHVFSFGAPLISPDDFAGTTIRAPHSATTYALFEALGATADDPAGSEFDEAVFSGDVAGVESTYLRGLPGGKLTVTGNVTPFPNVNSLVINGEAFDALSADQQTLLLDAAERARDVVVTNMVDDVAAAQAFCTNVGDVVLASDDNLAALSAATQPVHDELLQDEATAELIERISELKAQTPPPEPVAACEHAAADEVSSAAGAPSATIPNGSYTRTITRAHAEALGVDPAFIEAEIGDDELTLVYEFEDGRWTQSANSAGGDVFDVGDLGTYTYDDEGRLVTTSQSGGCRGCVGVIEWTFEDGVLAMTLVPVEGQSQPYDPVEILMTNGEYQQVE